MKLRFLLLAIAVPASAEFFLDLGGDVGYGYLNEKTASSAVRSYAGPFYGGGGGIELWHNNYGLILGARYRLSDLRFNDTLDYRSKGTTLAFPILIGYKVEENTGYALPSARDRIVHVGLGVTLTRDLQRDEGLDTAAVRDAAPDLDLWITLEGGMSKWIWEFLAISPQATLEFNLWADDQDDPAGAGRRSAWQAGLRLNFSLTTKPKR